MILKIINSALILFAVFMGFKQGISMISGKAEMTEMFGKWGFDKTGLMINGAFTILASVMILFPKTFVWGNFLMAAGILLIICLQLLNKDLKGAMIELPFLCLNLLIIYLQHPLKSWYSFFTENPAMTDDGNSVNFKSFFSNALGNEKFLSIDRVENDGKDIYGEFKAGKWGTFQTYFKFHKNAEGKFDKLDIGQAK